MEKWYKVVVAMAHQGAGKYRDTSNYVFANNVGEVFQRFKKMPCVKRSHIPTIEPLSGVEASELEKEIVSNHVNLEKAKMTWYFGTRRI